jgi:hypothetical protein
MIYNILVFTILEFVNIWKKYNRLKGGKLPLKPIFTNKFIIKIIQLSRSNKETSIEIKMDLFKETIQKN